MTASLVNASSVEHGSRTSRIRSTVSFAYATLLVILVWIAGSPLIMLLYSSITAEKDKLPFEATSFSIENYTRTLLDPKTFEVLLNTAIFTIGSTGIGVGVAIFLAWVIERTDVWGRQILFVMILIPMAIPSMIYAMAWIQLLGPNNGMINSILRSLALPELNVNVYSLGSMVFIQGVSLASHAYLLVAVAFRTLDGSWEEQSFIAGRGKLATLWLITMPMLRPALLAAALFFTVVAIESFDIPVTLGMTSHINVISTQIYWVTHPEGGQLPEYGRASALAVWLVLLALVLIHFYHRRTRDVKRFVTITGRGYRPRRLPLGKWRLTICLLSFAFVVVTVALPVFVLVWRSLLRFYVAPSFAALKILNLDAYRRIFNDSDFPPVLWNTVCVALGAAVLCTLIAAGVAWQVVRGQASPQWRRRLHTLAFFPQAFPSVVIGLSLVFLYLWLPIPIYGTLWIIGLAMVTKYLAYASGSIVAAQMQLSTELEEASRIAGASIGRTYFKIVCPLMMPALLACALWILIHVVRELGLSLMLYSLQSQVLSTKIWLLWENGRVADACATGVLTVVALLCLLSIPGAVRLIREARKRRATAVAAPGSLLRAS